MKPQIFPNSKKLEKECQNLIFVGFIGLRDPLRKEAKEAIEICKKAGMRPILVTGDHLLTAKAVAKELGLRTKEKNVIEGEKLDKLSEKEFQKIIEDIDVYARVEPRHKLKIVKAWQKRGKVVAMTGDGINDAPALKQADIGVALGSGTDVAKEVSDLILLPDSFNIIVLAIEEGRAIIDNIRKVITYLLASSFAEVILIASSLFFGWPLPVLAVQILWINLIEDGPLSLSLAFEPKEKDLMKRKPETRQLPLLNQEMKAIIFIIGIILNLLLVSLFWILQKFSNYDIGHIRTIIFVGLVIGSIFFIFSCKSLRHNLWQLNPFSNKFLIFSWFFSVIMVIGAVYLPPLQILLKTQPLNFFDWLLLLGLGGISLGLIEITKWYFIAKSSKHSSI
jgi:Ca2+-transporting ATPase